MAKPGSREAAELSQLARMDKQAVDLSKIPEEKKLAAKAEAEGRLGMRCDGCNRRITIGFAFTMIEVVPAKGGAAAVNVLKLAACNGNDDCDFAMKAKDGATVMEAVEYAWLDEDPLAGEGSVEAARQARAAAAG